LAEVVGAFYGGTRLERGFPLRLDLRMVYALDRLAPTPQAIPLPAAGRMIPA
jgi:hypothetical protein